MELTMRKEMFEALGIIGGLIGVQFVYAGNSVLLSYLMSMGLNPLTIVIFSAFATFLILSPISIYFERSKWPKKLSLKLITQLLLISFAGVTLFQSLFLKGIKLTSPAMATAMPNLAPGFIFVIAWTFRMERVKLGCLYSKVKIIGTLLCVVGALTMSIMHSSGTAEKEARISSPSPDIALDKDKIIGCLYLVAAVFALSSGVVLQATTLIDFPAPMSLCAITSLIGVVLTAAVQLIQDHKIELGWPLLSVRGLIGFSLLGGFVNGVSVSFSGWAMKKRGPVFVSTFSPIATVCSVILSVATIGDTVNIGSLAGMFLMFIGLYSVLWAKGKEGYHHEDQDDIESEYSAKKPLLS
ncbi:WAT1-related protein At5g47470-like [Carya illinoinensis]|uniref:WAT1-related protein n=1 Tax=Carya illinoinensis TaxID=32201 RepID=A0A8T1NUX3_CARIL|nr:WAT1-related protein At5g47470-like [Carya illinoinensis]KAG6635966.1 hypothetical protein CIPAW_11G079700 [Carya illinoinensis]